MNTRRPWRSRSAEPAPKSKWAKRWVLVAGVLAGTILIIDFFTKFFGLFDRIAAICCRKPDPPAVVITVKDTDWYGQCLDFAFQSLPADFVLGRVRLNIIGAAGPVPMPANYTAKVAEVKVDVELPLNVFTDVTLKPLDFEVRQQASKANDALYVEYCPTLQDSGTSGMLEVVPEFLSPGGDSIQLAVKLPQDKNTISFRVSRPQTITTVLKSRT